MRLEPDRPLALTMGEPAGIGGEIALRAWRARERGVPRFFMVDDPQRLETLCQSLGWKVPIRSISSPSEAAGAFETGLPVIPLALPVSADPGVATATNAPAVIESIDRALEFVAGGSASALVTNPIHKRVLLDAGFAHPGHTEYLAERSGAPGRGVMMLVSPTLRVVPVTVHLPLEQVPASLTEEAIVHAATATADGLRSYFGIAQPRLAVAGLNPHAGEDGALGRQEASIIRPAIAELRSRGIEVDGPRPADSLFHDEARRQYDAAICMYHDQALIPLKTIAFHGGVNVTLGLPIIRTSPDHGTALSIAGQGTADESSLIEALRLAAMMAMAQT